jgi:hypothetical protein
MNQALTPEEKEFNDYLHANHPDLMKKAYKVFCRYGKYYGGIYGYSYKGYNRLNKDIYTLARHFENDYSNFMKITKETLV